MNKVLIFLLGAGVGTFVTWKILDEKYKQLADEEIESVREYYKGKYEKKDENDEKVINVVQHEITKTFADNQVIEEKEEKNSYNKVIEEYKYVKKEPDPNYVKPYTIAPEEYGEWDDFKKVSWMFYADGTLADEGDMAISNPHHFVGNCLSKFGEYEDDSVYVRNENLEMDIEILRSMKTYQEQMEGVCY